MNYKKYYRKDGSLWYEQWCDEDGNFRREDGPAHIWYHEDGVTIRGEFWCKYGKLHRLDSPANTYYHKDGSIDKEYWYVDDILLTKEQVQAIKRNLTINKLICK